MTLDELKIGESGTVLSVKFNSKMRNRLSAMGITPGVRVTCLRYAPSGNPVEYRIMGYNLALRRADAAKIVIVEDGV